MGPSVLLALLTLTLAACAESGDPRGQEMTGAHRSGSDAVRQTMAANVGALRTVLPLALSEARFAAPERQDTIRQSLRTLAASGDALEAHGSRRATMPGASGEASFRYLSRSFAEDSRAALQRFEEGRLPASRFLLGRIVEDCTACHSRLPSPDSALGSRLFEDVELASLAPDERARLEVATRQFHAALDSYERLLADPAWSPARLDLEGILTDYLVVAIRVENDLARARRTLTQLAARSDTPRYLRRHLERWGGSLAALERAPAPENPLGRARELLAITGQGGVVPADRSALIHDLAASALLHRFASQHPEEDVALAEAHYLLGVAETRVRRSWWLSEAEFYLETAIRMAPRSPFAEPAYALYEEQIIDGYGGSGGVQLPPDVTARLTELRDLIDAR